MLVTAVRYSVVSKKYIHGFLWFVAGQAWSAQYTAPNFEAGALKSILGSGNSNITATGFIYNCPPRQILASITTSKCTLPKVIGSTGVAADFKSAVFCQFKFSCAQQSDITSLPSNASSPQSLSPPPPPRQPPLKTPPRPP